MDKRKLEIMIACVEYAIEQYETSNGEIRVMDDVTLEELQELLRKTRKK